MTINGFFEDQAPIGHFFSSEQKSNTPVSSSTDHEDGQSCSSSGVRSPDAGPPLMLAQVEAFAGNLEHYKFLADSDVDLRLSSAHYLEIEALGRILAETVGDSGWTIESSASLHFPTVLDAPTFSWPTLLRFAGTISCRLHTYLTRYSELSSWNLHAQLLPTIKVS